MSWSLRIRRLTASVVDYGSIGLCAVLLAAVLWPSGASVIEVGELRWFERHLLSLALVVPVTLTLALMDAGRGTPGKRVFAVAVKRVDGSPVTFGRSVLRTTLKVAFPWELAHAGIWSVRAGEPPTIAVASIGLAYVLVIAGGVAVLAGRRPWHDHLTRTAVVDRRVAAE